MPLPPETLAETACDAIMALPDGRRLIAVAGPPGAGKSTVSDLIATGLRARGRQALVVPMDGFHLDNRVLTDRGLLARKGSPATFDAAGFLNLVQRIAAGGQDIVYPVFDRDRDIAIAGAVALPPTAQDIIFEGNYLLLDQDPWRDLAPIWTYTLFATAPRDTLQDRLIRRWRDLGLPEETALRKVTTNDMPNVDLVLQDSRPADMTLGA